MKDFKSDFPIFKNNPWLVFLDNAASVQKPSYVIEGIKHFLENDYANIHRWAYNLSERSEIFFEESKKIIKEFILAKYSSEINFTYNSTYAMNLLTLSLKRSGKLKKWDKVLVSIVEHHANIVPWLILKEEIWIEIDYINVKADYSLDLNDLKKKLTPDVKLVSLTYASNVTGQVFDLIWASKIIREKNPNIIFVVDWSQAVPNFQVDVVALDCDFMVITGHKVMAETGIWVLYGKKELLKELTPWVGWWWAINWVRKQEYMPSGLPHRFEPGTPNIVWAVSFLRALEYIRSIWWYDTIVKNEEKLIKYVLEKYSKLENRVNIIGSKTWESRIWVFTFEIPGINSSDVAEYMAENNICVRAGQHCTEPLMDMCNLKSTFRMSLYLYNTKEDIDKFFSVLEEYLIKNNK